MTRKTWIDDFLERFQHRWETNSQYRAAMSGVLGLVFLITICACVGVVSTGANSVLHAMGIGSTANDGPGQTGSTGSDIKGVVTFAVTTVTPGPAGSIPFATIPTSGTPIPTATPSPTPTDTATATPCVSNCGGGGGSPRHSDWLRDRLTGTWHANQADKFVITYEQTEHWRICHHLRTSQEFLAAQSRSFSPLASPTDRNANSYLQCAFNTWLWHGTRHNHRGFFASGARFV